MFVFLSLLVSAEHGPGCDSLLAAAMYIHMFTFNFQMLKLASKSSESCYFIAATQLTDLYTVCS